MERGLGRGGNGMIFIPFSNEQSVTMDRFTSHHVNTYWTTADRGPSASRLDMRGLLNAVQSGTGGNMGGMARLNHPGRYTGSEWQLPWVEAVPIANNPANFMPYVNIFNEFNTLVGMEIINKFDTESQADRILWDNILSRTMPEGRPVWGFSDDDSHSIEAVGFSYNVMLMEELSLSHLRNSMDTGAFFAFSRVDREYGIYAGNISIWDWDGGFRGTAQERDAGQYSLSRLSGVHNLAVPRVNSIVVVDTADEDYITINATIGGRDIDTATCRGTTTHQHFRCCGEIRFIDWYADGVRIHRGKTLDLRNPDIQLGIYSYVRATIVTPQGVMYVQPFGISTMEEETDEPHEPPPVMVDGSANEAGLAPLGQAPGAPFELPAGTPPTEMGLQLPMGTTVQVRDHENNVTTAVATIKWNLNEIDYDPNNPAEQEFEIIGEVVPPQGAVGTGTPQFVKVTITIAARAAGPEVPPCPGCGSCDECVSAACDCNNTCSICNPRGGGSTRRGQSSTTQPAQGHIQCACPCDNCTFNGPDCRLRTGTEEDAEYWMLNSAIGRYENRVFDLRWIRDGGGYYEGELRICFISAIRQAGAASGFSGGHADILQAMDAQLLEVTLAITGVAGGTGVLSGISVGDLGAQVFHHFGSAPWWVGGANPGFEELNQERTISLNIAGGRSNGGNAGAPASGRITNSDRDLGIQMSIAEELIAGGRANRSTATISFEIIDARIIGAGYIPCDCDCCVQGEEGLEPLAAGQQNDDEPGVAEPGSNETTETPLVDRPVGPIDNYKPEAEVPPAVPNVPPSLTTLPEQRYGNGSSVWWIALTIVGATLVATTATVIIVKQVHRRKQ
jgi:hypothetical protein